MSDLGYALIGLGTTAVVWLVITGILLLARKLPAVVYWFKAGLYIAMVTVVTAVCVVSGYIVLALIGVVVESVFKWACSLF